LAGSARIVESAFSSTAEAGSFFERPDDHQRFTRLLIEYAPDLVRFVLVAGASSSSCLEKITR